MMMKKIFAIFAVLTMTVMATAQNYEYTSPIGMPYVNINAGAISQPLTTITDFGQIKPAAGIELGTYVTPIWGASAEGVAVFNLPKAEDQTLLNRHYVLGNGKMNVSNLLAGYKGYPRRVEVVLVAGAGWERDYFKNTNDDGTVADGFYGKNQMVYNTGAELNINLGQARAWQVSVRPSVIWGHPEGGFGFKPENAAARLNVGFTYKFGNRRLKSHNFVTNDYAVSQQDYDILAAKYEECHNRQPEKVEVPVETFVEKRIVERVDVPVYFGENLVLFPIGSATLSASNKEVIKHFAEDAQDDVVIYVVGSADSKTGTEAYNYDLAAKRAKAVKDELIKLGIDEKDIAVDTTLDGASTVKASRSALVTIMARPQ